MIIPGVRICSGGSQTPHYMTYNSSAFRSEIDDGGVVKCLQDLDHLHFGDGTMGIATSIHFLGVISSYQLSQSLFVAFLAATGNSSTRIAYVWLTGRPGPVLDPAVGGRCPPL